MSTEFIIRLVGLIIFGVGGIYLGTVVGDVGNYPAVFGSAVLGLVGALMGLVVTPYITSRPMRAARKILGQVSTRTLLAGIVGLVISLVISGLLAFPLSLLPAPFSQVLPIVVALLLSYLGVTVFITRQNEFFSALSFLPGRSGEDKRNENKEERVILLDTSVIIDGRIADIARTGFLSGALVIPRFVLNELQYIADSGDSLRRQRGRRGLEVLGQLQKNPAIPVKVSDLDVEGSAAVDDKLIILARQLGAPVLTNDFNLNRVAELQGVRILNINELANAVKAVFLPGEELNVRIIQEGREQGQGIGYLDDGTMVVVQGGSSYQNKELDIVVTKVLQTAAGRMIFARPTGSDS
jgi:uncharacterized protein YacL